MHAYHEARATVLSALAFTTTCAFAVEPQHVAEMQLPPQPKVKPAGIPASYVMVSPCVAAPIYGTSNRKVVFSEIMIPLKTLSAGFNYPNLGAVPGHTIDHVSIEWHPKGHPGMLVPHYDVHAYYISYADQKALCPNGIPDPDANMKM